nr:hypothetical protein [Burkholderia gladioli]
MRVVAPRGRLAQARGQGRGGAVPAGGDAGTAVPEAGAPQIRLGRPDHRGGRIGEVDLDASGGPHAQRLPAARADRHAGLAHRHGGEPVAAGLVDAGHQCDVDAGRARAPGLGAREPRRRAVVVAFAPVARGAQFLAGRAGGPYRHQRRIAFRRAHAKPHAQFRQDRPRIRMRFVELHQRQVMGRHGGQQAPARERVAGAGQRRRRAGFHQTARRQREPGFVQRRRHGGKQGIEIGRIRHAIASGARYLRPLEGRPARRRMPSIGVAGQRLRGRGWRHRVSVFAVRS